MKKVLFRARVGVVFVALLFAPFVTFAANNDPFRGGREAVNPTASVGVGQSTGAMTYSYPLAIPPGRNGVQPNLSLNYSSDDKRQDSVFGYGWSMNLPYIERTNKLGTNNFYNQDKAHTFFTSSISGELLPVVNTTPTGGNFLGMSLTTPPMAFLSAAEEAQPYGEEPEAPAPETSREETPPGTVTDVIARSFHTFASTFLPTHIYHPNEEADWAAARAQGTKDARKPIAGFPVAEEDRVATVEATRQTTRTWNSIILPKEDGTGKVAEIHAKQVNYVNAEGNFTPIDTNFVPGENGSFHMDNAPFSISAPPFADGSATFINNNRFDTRTKEVINEADLTMTIQPLDVAHVPGHIERADLRVPSGLAKDVSYIVYPNAYPTGDLIYYVHHGRIPRLEKMVRLNSAPASTDIQFLLSSSEQLNQEGISLRRGNSTTRGVGFKPFLMWDSSPIRPGFRMRMEEIEKTLTRAEGGFLLTKHLDAAFLASATYPVFTDATITVYPDADTETNTVDGTVGRWPIAPPGESWSTARSGSGNTAVDNDSGDGCATGISVITERLAGGGYRGITRGIALFDTSAIAGADSVSSSTLSFWGVCKQYTSGTFSHNIYSSTPASNTALVNADYSQTGTTALSDQAISSGSYVTGAYNNFLLNSSGLSNITKGGISKFSFKWTQDVSNTDPGVSVSDQVYVVNNAAEHAGTTSDPKLVVEYTIGAPSAPTNLLVDGLTNPSNIATTSPYFSALHVNASSTARATYYEIQVATSSSYWGVPSWDSGKKTLSSSTPPAMRSPNIYATTTFPTDGTTYYWRIKFWDQYNGEGAWSTSGDYFTMQIIGDYMAKVDDGSMMRYTLGSDGSWIAYDKRGWKYTFGATAASRIVDPDDSAKIQRWYLEEVMDTNGNKVLYRYTKDGGQIYPDYIDYTDHQGGSPFEVKFTKSLCDSVGSPCAPYATSSAYGFPVVTKYVISDMTTAVNGTIVHRFTPSYKLGDNQARLLLGSIKETGYNDTNGQGTTTLPVTNFDYLASTAVWTEVTDTSAYQMTFDVSDNFNQDYGQRLFDVNGDALPDWVKSDGSTSAVLLNTGLKWATSTAWTVPVAFSSGSVDQGVRMVDVNGDGLTDLVAATSTKVVYINNGKSTWTASTTWIFPESFTDTGNRDQGVQIVDLNADGLPDVLRSYYASTTGTTSKVYINTGTSWSQDTGWSVPEVLINDLKDSAVRLFDYNGDGLPDMLYSPYPYSSSALRIYYNNGRGWTRDYNGNVPFAFADNATTTLSAADKGVRFADFNGDGCVDIARGFDTDLREIRMSNCVSASSTVSVTGTLPEYFRSATSTSADYGVRMADVNGDGLLDFTRSYYDSVSGTRVRKVYLKDGAPPDLLKTVTTPRGGQTTVAYQSSARYLDSGNTQENPNLPFTLQTVRSLTTDNGSFIANSERAISLTTYDYQRGSYFASTTSATLRQFAGFGLVSVTDPAGGVTKTYFHQGNGNDASNGEYNDHISKAGKPYRTEILDTSANLYSRSINKWGRADYGDGRNFVKLGQTLTQTYDGDTTHRDTAASTTYNDTTGDISILVNYGEVTGNSDGTFTDSGSDLASTTFSYAASSTNSAVSLPSRELLANESGVTVKDTKWYYDDLATGLTSFGNQTKEERLISGSAYASTTKTYDTYGNVATSSDPLGNRTGFEYDGYHLFPITVMNPLTYRKLFSYDYSLGKAATSTDENSQSAVVVYDSLDRPIEEKRPDFTTPSTLVLKTSYTYTDSTSTPSSVFRRDYLSSATSTDAYTYTDGFGRTIQSKREAESANGWITKDTIYSTVGKVGLESLPYFATTSAYAAATSSAALTTETENFNAYSNGNLNGQGGWSGDTTPFQIQGTTVYEGAKAVDSLVTCPAGAGSNIARAFTFGTGYSSVSMYVRWHRLPGGTNDTINIRDAANNNIFQFWINEGSNGVLWFGSTASGEYLVSSNLPQDSWHHLEMERRASDGYARGRYNGGTWTAWIAPSNANALTNIDINYVDCNPGELLVDNIDVSRSIASVTSGLFTTYTYDALGRVRNVVNAVGTTTNTYNDWQLTVADPLSNKKDFIKDAYGNLSQVVEYLTSTSSATTTYAWNLNKKLTKITDSASNVRNFTYDLLGRLTGSEDLHASADTTFGTTSRQYDLASNLVQTYTPQGTAINYTYDTLNRITTEDSTTTPSLLDVVYRYDTCTNGKMRLCEMNANNAATTTYIYNPVGLTATTSKKIGTTIATTSTSYFRTGAQDTLVYPTGHKIAYVYNDAGDLNRVLGLSVGSTTWRALIESTNYGPTGQPTVIDYGNNTRTTFTYDAAHLYRLTRKLTVATGTTSGVSEQLLFLGMSLDGEDLPLLDVDTEPKPEFDPASPPLPLQGEGEGEGSESLSLPSLPGEGEDPSNNMASSDSSLIPTPSSLIPDSDSSLISDATTLTLPVRGKEVTRTWNTSSELAASGAGTIAEIHAKQINYLDARGEFTPIDTNFVRGENGTFQMTNAPFAVSVPAFADGVATFVNNNRFDTRTKERINEPDLTVHITAQDVAHVPGHIERADLRVPSGLARDVSYVVYPNAYPTGDLIYYVHHGRIPRLEKVVRLNSAPASLDISFLLAPDEPLAQEGTSLRRGNSETRGVGFKPFLMWDSSEPKPGFGAPLVEIAKTLTPTDGGYLLTKHLDRAFLASATYPVFTDATITVYPSPDPETNTVDGTVGRWPIASPGESWSTARSGSGNTAVDNDSGDGCATGISVITERFAGGGYRGITRGIALFDTSAIPSGGTVSSSTLSFWGVCKQYTSGTFSHNIYSATPASNTALANADYAQTGTTALSDTSVSTGSYTIGTYNNFTLNATGLANITKGGISKFAFKWTQDVSNTDPGVSVGDQVYTLNYAAEHAGTTSDPKLVVEYTGVTPSPSTGLLLDGLTNPSNIATSSPYFSALHVNASSTARATYYEIQVATSSAYWSAPTWDSGQKTLSSSTPPNMRTPNIYSTSTFPVDGSTYYWRIKFWDQYSSVGDWSTSTAYWTTRGASTTLQDLNYTYDAVGNISSIIDRSGTNSAASTTYSYDSLYRLTRASTTDAIVTDWLETYSYDNLGNILSKSDVGAYTYAGTGFANPHAPTTINGVTYSYDKAGNLTGFGTTAYNWNYRNRLTDVNNSGTTTHYLYDESDQRVEQDIKRGALATTTTKYYSSLYETTGATTTLYVYAFGQLLSTIEGNGSATSTYIAHTDHQGSVSVMSDKNGTLAQLATTYPFGEPRNDEHPANFDEGRKFVGQYYDRPTSLSYLQARYYDGNRGQFLSQDPVFNRDPARQKLENPQSLNSYSYAHNNPINLSDPGGEAASQSQQIQQLQLKITILTAILSLYQMGATQQANTAYSNYQAGVGSGGGGGNSWGAKEVAADKFAKAVVDPIGGAVTTISSPSIPVVLGVFAGFAGGGEISEAKSLIWSVGKAGTSAKNAFKHFLDHGDDFGAENALDYVKKAKEFLFSPPGGTKTIIRTNGDKVLYHEETNTFGVMDETGTPNTFLKPDTNKHPYPTNLDYFYSQSW